MKPTKEQEEKILAHIEAEWEIFLEDVYLRLSPRPSEATITALKAGFYSGFRAGVNAMHDADKIL